MDSKDARAMIDALKWICEELLMTEAVRLILCHQSEIVSSGMGLSHVWSGGGKST